jgi:hypothetical protein
LTRPHITSRKAHRDKRECQGNLNHLHDDILPYVSFGSPKSNLAPKTRERLRHHGDQEAP